MAKGGQSKAAGRMDAAWKLYDAGDVVAARREVKRLLADNPTEAERAQATDLLERAGFPREGLYLAAAAAVLIVAYIILGIVRG